MDRNKSKWIRGLMEIVWKQQRRILKILFLFLEDIFLPSLCSTPPPPPETLIKCCWVQDQKLQSEEQIWPFETQLEIINILEMQSRPALLCILTARRKSEGTPGHGVNLGRKSHIQRGNNCNDGEQSLCCFQLNTTSRLDSLCSLCSRTVRFSTPFPSFFSSNVPRAFLPWNDLFSSPFHPS